MPWSEVTRMSLREEFVKLASQPGANRRQLCRRFKISPRVGYKWLKRYAQEGISGLEDRSRRPQHAPARTAAGMEAAVIRERLNSDGCWGGRKLARVLSDQGVVGVPAPSTITGILRRHGLLDPQLSAQRRSWKSFEREAPNQLWQMDFKGHIALLKGRCHPLTVVDDHSRFALAVRACADERMATVQRALREIFERYGLPAQMLMDNGSPWGGAEHPFTELSLWLIRLGISVAHGRARHPQTQGKNERFNRTLKLEVLRRCVLSTLAQCQSRFDQFRDRYNLRRPHQALNLDTPASHYHPSAVAFPTYLPPIEYPADTIVRKVQAQGWLSYRGFSFRVSKALRGYPVALRPCAPDGRFEVYFCHQVVAVIDLNRPNEVLTADAMSASSSYKGDV
jgi:transposase InsO family protein